MKKIAFLFLATAFTFSGVAQSSKVVNAINYLSDYGTSKDPESLQKAKENIDLASEHPDTKDKAKTQVNKGKIYLTIYEANKRAQEEKLMSITDPNKRTFVAFQNTPTTELETAYQAFVKAKALDDKGNYTAELKSIPNIGIYFDNTGRSNYNAKKYPEALSAFERAYEISGGKDTTVLYFLAASSDLAQQYDKAKQYYQKMIDTKQGQGATYSSLMNVHLMMKDSVYGMEILKKGRAAYPNDINLVISETNYFLKTNKSQEALNNLNIAIQAKPTDANLYLVRGNIYDNLANPKDAAGKDLEKPKTYAENIKLAEADYKKAIEIKPDYFDALYNLGVLYNNQGVELNKQADKITDQKKYEAANAKATEQFALAMPVLEKAMEVNPKERNTMIALKQIYARMQLLDKLKEINAKLKG
ncbi:MAG: tetratricopeptide repeat protein [Bacteroidota bacterium]